MENELKNCLTTHLDLYIQFYVQQFYTIDNFPFEATITQWKNTKGQYCVEFLSKWHVGGFWILKVILVFFCVLNPLSNGANCFSIYFPNFNWMWGISTFSLNSFSFVNVHTSLSMVILFVSNLFYYLWAPSSLVCKFIGQLWSNIY